MSVRERNITQFLQQFDQGDQTAFDKLFQFVYDELYQIAQSRRRQWQGNNTLNTTAVLHEAYLKLVDQSEAGWKNRNHFFAVASRAMRHILINYARDQKRQKRGGDWQRATLDRFSLSATGEIDLSEDRKDGLLILDEVLKHLEKKNPRQAQIVECLFFGGLTVDETAAALNVSPSTVKRGWKTAQLWLYREMQQEGVP